MLGNVSPRTIRIDSSAVVFPGRDNRTALSIKVFDGRAYRAANLVGVSRWVLGLPELGAAFDSLTEPVFSVAGSVLTIDLSDYAVQDGIHPCTLIAYDAEHPNGQVLVDNADCIVSLVFRSISASGGMPLPIQQQVEEAPDDGVPYVRQNRGWAPAAAAAVLSVNGQTGAVVLGAADIGADPAGTAAAAVAGLATVASSGAYADLVDKPFIPSTAGDVGAATAAQGERADTAVQPDSLASALAGKVDVQAGYGLSQNNYTDAEKAKLASIEGSHFKGTFLTLAALQAAFPTASAGDYADVDAGTSAPVLRYIWDATDAEWVAQAGSADPLTAAQVKTLYESNPDTNAFTDAEKSKLGGVAAGATANPDTDSLAEGASNQYHTAARVRAVLLTGLSLADSAVVAATDTVLQAIGKLAARLALAFDRANHTGTQAISTVSGLEATLAGKEHLLTAGANIVIDRSNPAAPVISGTSVAGGMAPVVEVTASRALALTDAGAYLRSTSAAAVTLTVPAQSSVAWAADTEIHIEQGGAGAVTVAGDVGVTINKLATATATIAGQYGVVTLKRTAENVWTLFGALGGA